MATKKKSESTQGSVAEIGQTVPSNLKFTLIVGVGVLWADFVREGINSIFSLVHFQSLVLSDFVLAVIATGIAYAVLVSYRRIVNRLKKLKIGS